MTKNTLADRLNMAMKLSGMSQGALAKASGVAQPTIWRLTKGNAHGSTKIIEIAKALNVSPEWLASGTGPMKDDGQESYANKIELTPDEEELLKIYRGLPDEEAKRFLMEMKAKKAHYDAIVEEMLRKRHGKVS